MNRFHGMRKAVIGSIVLSCVAVWLPPFPAVSAATPPAKPAEGLQILDVLQNAITSLAERVKPTVVNVLPGDQSGRSGSPRERTPNTPGSGSGFFIDETGYIVTNNHVVGDATEVSVRLSDRTSYSADIVGRDPDTDLALLKIRNADRRFPSVTFGDSSGVKVGQWVIAVGNPFGLDRTVTLGVVSGVGRENMNLSRYENFIQTDASINPGNSGGPLFNTKGEVVGINTAIINFAQGIGFAIPSNMAERIIEQLKTQGKVVRGWLGVGIQPVTSELASKFKVDEGTGVLVNEVFENNPADEAGLKPGDVITKVDGKTVNSPNQLSRMIASLSPGDTATLEIIRDGDHQDLTVAIGKRDENPVVASLPPSQEEVKLGIDVQNLTPDLAEKFKLEEEQGVLVTNVEQESIAHTEGLRKGDLIKEVNREDVKSVREFSNRLGKVRPGDTVLLRVIRESRAFYVVLKTQ